MEGVKEKEQKEFKDSKEKVRKEWKEKEGEEFKDLEEKERKE